MYKSLAMRLMKKPFAFEIGSSRDSREEGRDEVTMPYYINVEFKLDEKK